MSSIDNDITANTGEEQGNEKNTGDVQNTVGIAGDPSSSNQLPNDINVSEEITDVTGIIVHYSTTKTIVYVIIYPGFSGLFVTNMTSSTE